MDARKRKLRREQIDRHIDELHPLVSEPPKGGWLRAHREALGMTLDAFASRLGISKQAAHQLERAEDGDAITVRRLRAAANALDCDLIVRLVPRVPMEQAVQERALLVARERVSRIYHSMALEDQALLPDAAKRMIQDEADELVKRGDSSIWE